MWDIGRLVLDSLLVGLPYTLDFLGVWLVYRLLNDFDLTVDGAFTMGAAVTATLIVSHGMNPAIATVVAAFCGLMAGAGTALVHLRLRVPLLLAGIISFIGLYSVNLRIMGDAPNIALVQSPTVFTTFGSSLSADYVQLVMMIIIIAAVIGVLGLFLKTQLGLGMRATGVNMLMARSVGINTAAMVFLFVTIGNFLAGLSGSITAQQQQFADVNMGIGVILIGIAAILLGEVILRRTGTVWAGMAAVVLGTLIYFLIVSIVLRLGFNPTDLRALTSVVLLIAIAAGMAANWTEKRFRHRPLVGAGADGIVVRSHATNAFQRPAEEANLRPTVPVLLGPSGARPIPAGRLERGTLGRKRSSVGLSLKKVTVIYNRGTPTQVLALRDFSLDVPAGQFLTVIGSNGAGKSTLASVIAGSVPVATGGVWFGNQAVTRTPDFSRARRIARIFQDPTAGTCPTFSVEENIALAERRGQARGLGLAVTSKSRKRYFDYLRQFDLGFEHRMADKVGGLSGGQRQALALLMAFMTEPDILLLDEHVAALDPRNQFLLQELTAQLSAESHCTTIMVTHNMDSAIKYGDRMIMMNQGAILFDVAGAPKQQLTVERLVASFHDLGRASAVTDEMVLG